MLPWDGALHPQHVAVQGLILSAGQKNPSASRFGKKKHQLFNRDDTKPLKT